MARPTIALTSLLVAWTACAGGTSAQPVSSSAPVLSNDWKQVTSTNFVVVGNASDRSLRNALVQLERFREAILPLFPSSQRPAPVPTMLVLFKDAAALRPFKPRDDQGKIQETVAGYFSRTPDAIHMVSSVYADSSDTYFVLFHEYAHHLIHQSGREIPTWADEGLAEFFGTFRTENDGSGGVIGTPPKWRLASLTPASPLLPFDRFFTAEGVARTFRNVGARQTFYAQAWALVHYLVIGKRAGQLEVYLRAIQNGQSPDEAFGSAFGVPYATLLGELRAYLARFSVPGIKVSFPKPLQASNAPVERMRESDALAVQGRLLLETGAFDDAETRLRRAADLDAQHVPARIGLARILSQRQQDDEALAALRAVTADAPADFAANYWLARMLTEAGHHDEALQVSNAIVKINDRSPDAWLQLSVAAVAMNRASQAAAAIQQARLLFPSPSWRANRARRLFDIGRYTEAAGDVAAYAEEAGWGNEGVPYQVFMAALAHWHLNEPDRAAGMLATLAPEVEDGTWTAVVLRFFQGQLTDKDFVDRARGIGQETEAHAYVGLKAAIAGRTADALAHLEWVETRGARNYIEYGLARKELQRMRAVVRQ